MKHYLQGSIPTGYGAPYNTPIAAFLQAQSQETINAITQFLISTQVGTLSSSLGLILSGCVLTLGTTTTITAGAIYFNGEIYLSSNTGTQTISTPNTSGYALYGIITNSYDASDPQILVNGALGTTTPVNMLQSKTVTWTYTNAPTGTYFLAAEYIGSIFTSFLANATLPATVATLNSNVATLETEVSTLQSNTLLYSWTNISSFGTGWTAGSTTPQYRIDGLGRVYLRGFFDSSSGASGTIATLPAGIRPTTYLIYPTYVYTSGPGLGYLTINSLGVIGVPSAYIGTGYLVNLDGITFLNS